MSVDPLLPTMSKVLCAAVLEGNLVKVREVLKKGRNVETDGEPKDMRFELMFETGRPRTALQLAAQHGHLDCVKLLLEAVKEVGPDKTDMRFRLVRFENYGQETALRLAASEGHDEVVEALLEGVKEVGPDKEDMRFKLLQIDNSSAYGNTALNVAVLENHAKVVRALLEAVKEAAAPTPDARERLLDLKCSYPKNKTALDVFVMHVRGASVRTESWERETEERICGYFFDAGADLNATFFNLNHNMNITDIEKFEQSHRDFYKLYNARSAERLRAAIEKTAIFVPSMARWVDARLGARFGRHRVIDAIEQIIEHYRTNAIEYEGRDADEGRNADKRRIIDRESQWTATNFDKLKAIWRAFKSSMREYLEHLLTFERFRKEPPATAVREVIVLLNQTNENPIMDRIAIFAEARFGGERGQCRLRL